MGLADLLNDVHPAWETVQVGHDHQLDFGIERKRLFQRDRIHVPAVGLCVDEYRHAALIDHGVERGVKGHV